MPKWKGKIKFILPKDQSKMSEHEDSWKCEDSHPCMVDWAKNARIGSSGCSPAQRVIGRRYKMPWSLLDEKQRGELASLEKLRSLA